MNLYRKLNLALQQVGFPPLKHATSYRKIGAGAWHNAYLVSLTSGERFVIRLRKQIIYGKQELFDSQYLYEDYEPVGLFYRQANRCQLGICPEFYKYILTPELTFTIESYMGPTISLQALTTQEAFRFGQQVGHFFRKMHATPPHLNGFGELIWTNQSIQGQDHRNLADIWQAEVTTFYEQFDQLSQSGFQFEQVAIKSKLDYILNNRSIETEPVSLVNGDISPENLIAKRKNFSGLIDPVPKLHNGLRYAAFFIYCYKSYLPNLYNAPRYLRHQFQHHGPVMVAMADGYINGYTQEDMELKHKLAQEYFLWGLDVAFENFKRLTSEMTEEIYLRAGDKKTIAERLQICLRELESHQLN